MRRPLRKPHGLRNEDIENYEETADYVVYYEGSNIIALDGHSGLEISRSTDASTVIQAAIDALTTGGIIFIKPGTYSIVTGLTMGVDSDNLSIIGSGGGYWETSGATIFSQGGDIDILTINGLATGTRVKHPIISGIKFYNSAAHTGMGIHVLWATTLTIEHCGFKGFQEEAIKMESVWASIVSDCHFKNNGDVGTTLSTVWIGSTGADDSTTPIIKDCVFEVNDYRMITCNCARMKVYGCFFEATGNAPSDIGITGTFASSIISGNSFVDLEAIPTMYWIESKGWNNIIANNSFSGSKAAIFNTGAVVRYNVITGNVISGCYDYGIKLVSTHPNLVCNNIINACGHAGVFGGIYVTTRQYIIGNEIVDCDAYAIYISGASALTIKDNWIHEEINAGDLDRGISCAGGADNNFFIGNRIENCAVSYIAGAGASTVIKDNTGYVTENEGASGVTADGATIAHGLSAAPTGVLITPTIAGDIVSVSALAAATFTVSIKDEGGGAGTAQVLYWRAWV